MHFRHLTLAEIKGAAPVRRPAAVIISDYGLGFAITKSDAIAAHGSLLPERDCELATTKVRTPIVPPSSREMDLKLPQDLSRPSSEQHSIPARTSAARERRGN